ncbi:MAG: hypothetical protein V1837_03010 [Candidatus Woesearchaeota archaeon]
MTNITRVTEAYINNHPTIRQAIRANLVNYSKLSRKILQETGMKSKDAVLIACRRYYNKTKGQAQSTDIISLLKGTKLSIRDKIAVVILEPDVKYQGLLNLQKEADESNETVHIMKGANAVTIIVTEDFLGLVKRIFGQNIIKVSTGLVEIMMKSPARLEQVPGVMAYIYTLFGENNVNIIETISCWTDTIMVIKKEELSKTMGFLNF